MAKGWVLNSSSFFSLQNRSYIAFNYTFICNAIDHISRQYFSSCTPNLFARWVFRFAASSKIFASARSTEKCFLAQADRKLSPG